MHESPALDLYGNNQKIALKILVVKRKCSLLFLKFFKYKPFYIIPPKEREKEPFCIKCQNAHLLLRGIYTYRSLKNLMKHNSVTQFIKNDPKKDVKRFSECDGTKEINYCF